MEVLDSLGLRSARADLDRAFSQTPDIDHFCSSSAWTFAADVALMPPRELYCRRGEHGWALLARRVQDNGWSCLEPLEAAWCLASPFALGREDNAVAFASEVVRDWEAHAPRDVLLLSGLALGSPLFRALALTLRGSHELTTELVPPARRFRASLAGGMDGFLGRRSRAFRERLRQAERKAESTGVRFEPLRVDDTANAALLYDRLVALEARSWKGLSGDGLLVPSMQAFYREMLPLLAADGAVRAHVGRKDDEDVAMILGAVSSTPDGVVYRGLQFSFDDAFRPLSLGNLAQLAQIRALVEEGVAVYDLGSEVEYKRRWGERCLETVTLVAIPRALRQERREAARDAPE